MTELEIVYAELEKTRFKLEVVRLQRNALEEELRTKRPQSDEKLKDILEDLNTIRQQSNLPLKTPEMRDFVSALGLR